jgi:transcriptional regulator with XRE-family HTH domain
MSLVERGRSSLALTSLFAVARALGVDVAQLLPATEELSHGHEGCQVVREYAREITPVRVGADPNQIEIIDIGEVPLSYLAHPAMRVRVKAAGPLSSLYGENRFALCD